jgi:hypothetical protein
MKTRAPLKTGTFAGFFHKLLRVLPLVFCGALLFLSVLIPIHFQKNTNPVVIPDQRSEASAEPGSSIYAKTQRVLFFVFKKYIGKRLRLLTVALDTGSALAALVCPA